MAVLATASVEDTLDIGTKVLAMLDRCEDNVPDDYSRGQAPSIAAILREAKLRSWRTFHKKAHLVHVFREVCAPHIEITPTRHIGGSSEDMEDKMRISDTRPEAVGRAVLAALSDAE